MNIAEVREVLGLLQEADLHGGLISVKKISDHPKYSIELKLRTTGRKKYTCFDKICREIKDNIEYLNLLSSPF